MNLYEYYYLEKKRLEYLKRLPPDKAQEEFLRYLRIEWNIPDKLDGKETLYNNYEELL